MATRIVTMTTSSRPSLVVSFAVAIERLYEVFGRYPRPRGETYSAYSDVTATDAAAIRERPLRELSGRDLAKYAMRAVVTWGDADELRYYLPRLLELLVIERGWADKPTVMLNLSTAGWRSWPAAEQEAIETFVLALWSPLLAGQLKLSLAELALGCSLAGISLQPIAETWRDAPAVASAFQLADLVTLERDELLRDGAFGTRWSPAARRVLEGMVTDPEARARLEHACLLTPDADAARRVSDAIEILDAMPTPPGGR